MSEYVIARASVVDIDTGEDFEEVFYKVFLKDSDGVVWFEREFVKTGYCSKCQEYIFGDKKEKEYSF